MGKLFDSIGGLFIGMILILVLFTMCTNPNVENDRVKKGEHSDFEISLSESDIGRFKADLSNVMNYSEYRPKDKKDYLPDVEGKLHDFAISYTVDPEGEREPYIITELENVKGKLDSYDEFKATLSIVPEQDFYETPIDSIRTKMTFYFVNEKGETLGKYSIDSKQTVPIKFDLKGSKKLYIVAETDYKELFIGSVLSPRLIKK